MRVPDPEPGAEPALPHRPVVGVDTGGTFTDFVVLDGGRLEVHKVPSTPDDPARAVVDGLRQILGDRTAEIVHGSTVATNALLERRGARVALLTTAGFEDVLAIGRQARPKIYDLAVTRAPPLVDGALRLGVRERVGAGGELLQALDEAEVRAARERVLASGAEAVAICLLHAYARADHERALLEALAGSGLYLSASHDVLPEFREYERTATTVVNAYVGPVMSRYLARLEGELDGERVRIMQSNGGLLSVTEAGRYAVRTILSGPAGGAVGGFELGRRAGFDQVITFDMGGTSTDVGLCPGELVRTSETVIGETPIRVPVLDVHTVGAGGGSIAHVDPGGALRVGPRSAGAVPGPISYGRGGTEPTVTDAHLLLGRLSADHFLGGEQRLERGPVEAAMERLAERLGLSPVAAAEGIVRVANATMERAIRVISLERGWDPRDFTLVCFGGAGAMHAADLAAGLGIPRVLVPRAAGTLSALGMLLADVVRDVSRSILTPLPELDRGRLDHLFTELEERVRRSVRADGVAAEAVSLERSLDLRYVGQGYELPVADGPDLAAAFHALHEQRYGYSDPARPVEAVTVRLRAVGRKEKPQLPAAELTGGDPAAAVLEARHRLVIDGEAHLARLLDRQRLRPGDAFTGPALVVEYSTTTVVPPAWRCRVDRFSNLVLER